MVHLPVYPLPKELKQVLDNDVEKNMSENSRVYAKIMNLWKEVKRIAVEQTHYLQFLKFALYLEEHQCELNMNEYDLLNKCIIKTNTKHLNTNVFKINVDEWLEDERPPIKEKDLFDVIDTTNEKVYTLRIVNLYKNSFTAIDVNSMFLKNYSATRTYDIQFRYLNYPLRCNHFALWLTEDRKTVDYLFPNNLKPRSPDTYEINLANIKFCNPNIKGNYEQTQAMLSILNRSSCPYPYILYGPPGTGKTATLVETICQIVVRNSANNVLVCTPSNTAADEVTKRLLVYKSQLVFRMYSQAKDPLTIDEKILPYCNWEIKDGKRKISVVKLVDILKKRIVVTTLCSSMRLTLIGLRNDHFSHVIIDEAGQSIEPDILIPFSLVSWNKNLYSQIVLAGDPKQLGPTVMSTLAKVVLGRSILERLMSYPAYQKMSNGKYNPRYMTKLLLNYRNHPGIIKISNELFYNNELMTKSTAQQTAFPVIFYSALDGKEQKFQHSTSSCNFIEVGMVVKLIEHIIENKEAWDIGKDCTEDIGVLTPFKLQRKEIKRELRRRNLPNINVGTVEFFQGQERKIIIISTVRTRTFSSGESRHIGFLSDPKRFNVAVTRAKSRLIVVGHPHALQTAPCWRHLLKYCSDNGSYYGENLDLRYSDENARSYYSLERSNIVRSSDIFKWNKFKIFALDRKDSEADIMGTTKMILNLEKNTTRSIQSIAPAVPVGRLWNFPELKPIHPTLSVRSTSPIQKIPISELKDLSLAQKVKLTSPIETPLILPGKIYIPDTDTTPIPISPIPEVKVQPIDPSTSSESISSLKMNPTPSTSPVKPANPIQLVKPLPSVEPTSSQEINSVIPSALAIDPRPVPEAAEPIQSESQRNTSIKPKAKKKKRCTIQ